MAQTDDTFRIEYQIETTAKGWRKADTQRTELKKIIDNWLTYGDGRQWTSVFGQSTKQTYDAVMALKSQYSLLVQRPDVIKLLRRVRVVKVNLTLTRARDSKIVSTMNVLEGTYTYDKN